MNIKTAIKILEALASGCSPVTGEMLHKESILHERDVIRAFQIAIDLMEQEYSSKEGDLIAEEDIQNAIKLFENANRNPTPTSMTGFFLGTRKFRNESIVAHELYGKFADVFTKGNLLDYFTQYLADSTLINRKISKNQIYKEIDFFQKEKFNKLSDMAKNQLKEKVIELGILKTENLTEYILNARITYPRAYEVWTEKEKELLRKAIMYTNDLDLLSECFQRGKGSIETYGQQLIYNSTKSLE